MRGKGKADWYLLLERRPLLWLRARYSQYADRLRCGRHARTPLCLPVALDSCSSLAAPGEQAGASAAEREPARTCPGTAGRAGRTSESPSP